ncbi:hypothetical protein D6D18_07352 [Aureobasidium pullulans]|nr:hypothetical protein D6D18_07352 [Aureobasidium pullulans]
MPLEVRQVERSDIADIAKMDQLIMADVGITRAIWKIQEEEGDDITYSFMRFISMGMEHNSQSFWKVVDTDTDEMISVAKFTFQYHEGEAYQDTPVEGEAPPPTRLLEFFGQINKVSNEFARQNYAGRPHAHLAYLATLPEHRKRGAAHMLLERGTNKADEAGLDMYLQASPEGARLYKKFGFEEKQYEDVDLKPFGVDMGNGIRFRRLSTTIIHVSKLSPGKFYGWVWAWTCGRQERAVVGNVERSVVLRCHHATSDRVPLDFDAEAFEQKPSCFLFRRSAWPASASDKFRSCSCICMTPMYSHANKSTMRLQTLDNKPLPAPPSPTLTNPDMVLPNAFVLDVHEAQRPPSPSYLQAQATKKLGSKRKSRPNLRAPSQSPAHAYASSPTLNVESPAWDDRRLSYTASSILTEDLENMQIPRFESSLDSDTETLDEDDFDIDTPSELSYGDVLKSEQSNVTLMRAELILANAKKRLNLMDQNLRGAREIVTPLTAAKLKRATSLTTGPVRNTSFSRPRYLPHNQHTSNTQHMRVLSDSEVQPDERRYMSLNVNSTPSWTSNPVRTTRSSELLRHPRSPLSPDPQLDTVSEEQSVRSQTSAHNLREQMMQLRGRISTLKERAQEENLRRRSTNNLRETCPLNDADTVSGASATTQHSNPRSIYEDAPESSPQVSGPRHEDRDDAFDYSKFFLHSATGSFEPNTPTRHARSTSLSSSDSCLTARAYPVNSGHVTSGAEEEEELQPPPTPETPEALRHIEEVKLPARMQHRRGLSAESLATIATFETAEEGHQASIAQWLSRSTSASSIHNPASPPKPSRSHPSTQTGLPSPSIPPTYTPASTQQGQQYISISPSATTLAVSALLDPTKGKGLGSKDEALVYTLVESLREFVGELQSGAGGEERRRSLRRRLDEARRVLEGEDIERYD